MTTDIFSDQSKRTCQNSDNLSFKRPEFEAADDDDDDDVFVQTLDLTVNLGRWPISF